MEIAESVCTEKQMEVLRLRDEGYGHRRIARMLLISPSAAKDRLDAADVRLRKLVATTK